MHRPSSPRTRQMDDAAQFNACVYNLIQLIPPQKVTSCGHIAKLAGTPRQARRVNQLVKLLGQTSSSAPWHRVISTSGIVADHSGLGALQKRALEGEGVSVRTGILGESRIEFNRWGWFPDHAVIPSEVESVDEWGA
ncbi:6-O-methylguanine DNA methyltransferase [Pisolithus orientalis]|uniref:6-O-methylguanine DNA methyltransferase n=1 Tax=Pisolithus orientalis TaxID=936130 RepID=UPI002223F70F|nr:6-O-methylguanine DNA methyltransferase [Pisolithus orientalis]KAI6008884.1 6-O-methylguanine DNA methyltransferase [Pisolithus orientalis]